jgi:hypothetical protein
MKTLLTIVLAVGALVFGATVSLMSGAAVAHHNVTHSLAQCGSIICPGPKQAPPTVIRGRKATTERQSASPR